MAEKHYYEQLKYAETYLMPYLKSHVPDICSQKILEVGSGEGGLLSYFHENVSLIKGIEISQNRVELGKSLDKKIDLSVGDITSEDLLKDESGTFDLIIMRDVIEHVENKDLIFKNFQRLLKPSGKAFISFPPKYSSYAGHQQVGKKFKFIPYIHLLPSNIIKRLGKALNESEHMVNEVLLNYKQSLSIARYEKLCAAAGFKTIDSKVFISRPAFKIRYGWKIINGPKLPILKEILNQGYEAIIQKS